MMSQYVVRRLPQFVRQLFRSCDVAQEPGAMNEDAAWHVMVRYCARDVSPAEAERVEQWCVGDPERERVRRGLLRITAISRDVGVAYQRAAAWEQLRRRIEMAKDQPANVRPMFLGMSAGARRPRRPTRSRRLVVAGAAAALLGVVSLWRYGRLDIGAWRSAPVPHAYVASRGQRLAIKLPDGSAVTLGPESRLSVSDAKFARSRVVHLEGMAHFVVAHDRAHPFVVYGGEAAVQAVGTAFTVRAYPDDSAAQVVVITGRVLLRSAGASDSTGTVLDPGDLGRRNSNGLVSVTHGVDLDRYTGWMSGRLSYQLTPAGVVARDLERWYELTIQIDSPSLRNARINGAFEPKRSPEQAMKLFASVLGATYTLHGDTVHVHKP
jgi:transmembrane sensor